MATAPDLNKMSYNELRKLMQAAEEALTSKRDEELKVLADGYAKKAAAAGFTPEEAIEALKPYLPQTRSKRGASGEARPAKYRDPATGETWSGRGRAARWIVAYEEAGRSRDEFLIK